MSAGNPSDAPSDSKLPRGVRQESCLFGQTRTYIVASSQGEIIMRCTVTAGLADTALVTELRAWLDGVDPIARQLSLA